MSLLLKRILSSLAVVVMTCVQVFGMQRGFVCAHKDAEVNTQAEHCHRVASAGHDALTPCEKASSKDCADDKNTEHHAPLVEALQVDSTVLAALVMPAYTPVLTSEISFHEWVPAQELLAQEVLRGPPDSRVLIPPSALQVARCMVQLV
ncbi:MAG: hypothetical protein JWO89_411 [Verrucomicrobiaceae bacterium]|nr:hypothetical protein [Verrucomicrobiaceae bacterium]